MEEMGKAQLWIQGRNIILKGNSKIWKGNIWIGIMSGYKEEKDLKDLLRYGIVPSGKHQQ